MVTLEQMDISQGLYLVSVILMDQLVHLLLENTLLSVIVYIHIN